jgi:hypothetical protein
MNLICALLAVWIVAGCGTTKQVAASEGKGTRRTFRASYETTWMASRGAVANNELRAFKIDREGGLILAKRGIGMTTFGEHVGVWVHPLGPQLTSVEVVSRHVGPPVLPDQGVEQPILDDIATMLDQ